MNSAQDLLERNITPFIENTRDNSARSNAALFLRDYFRAFPDPVYHEIANRLEFPNDDSGEIELWDRIDSSDPNNRTAVLKTKNGGRKYWDNYHFSEEIFRTEPLPFEIHIINKKWPLKKV